jgi:hypothetical protein
MISTRIEKLKFIVEEMQIAFHLSRLLTDQFAARTMARHILVRSENFIVSVVTKFAGLLVKLRDGHQVADWAK